MRPATLLTLALLALLTACATAPPTMLEVMEPETMPLKALMAKSVAATCGTPTGHYLDTTQTCDPEVIDDRAFGAHRLAWRGRPWLLVNRGNELHLWDVADPRRPVLRSTSRFRVGNQGDSDFDLMEFTVCDDCRWGVAWYKLATVVFDLGTAAQPSFTDWRIVTGAVSGLGGATWYHGRDQWLATSSLGGSCSGGSTLYQLAGLSAQTPVGCVLAGTRPVTVVRGLYDRGSVYLTDSSTRLYHFLGSGAGLTYRSELGRAAYGGCSWTGLDAAPGVLVAASASGTRLWDTTDAALPVLAGEIPGAAYVATVSPPLLVTAEAIADQHRERVWDVRELAAPVALSAALWPDTHQCAMYQSSTLVDDVLLSWRWSVAEGFDLADCVDEEPPYSEWIFLDGFESGNTSGWDEVVP